MVTSVCRELASTLWMFLELIEENEEPGELFDDEDDERGDGELFADDDNERGLGSIWPCPEHGFRRYLSTLKKMTVQ